MDENRGEHFKHAGFIFCKLHLTPVPLSEKHGIGKFFSLGNFCIS
ncbi:hypothetical protein [Wolbachia endosymbiont of Tettigetta isshikii]